MRFQGGGGGSYERGYPAELLLCFCEAAAHTIDYGPFIKGLRARRQLGLRPYLVQLWSHYTLSLGVTKSLQSTRVAWHSLAKKDAITGEGVSSCASWGDMHGGRVAIWVSYRLSVDVGLRSAIPFWFKRSNHETPSYRKIKGS